MISVLNIAGIGHGPEEYARSPIHDLIVAELSKRLHYRLDVVFIPSADVDIQGDELVCYQKPPSLQAKRILEATSERCKVIAVAHSTGCVSLLEAMKHDRDIVGVFVSPTILSPVEEVFDSPSFARRYEADEEGKRPGRLTPNKMPYSVLFNESYFQDALMQDVTRRMRLEDIAQLLTDRGHLFLGEHDWNQRANEYSDLFECVTLVPQETHSFEANSESPVIVASWIKKMISKQVST